MIKQSDLKKIRQNNGLTQLDMSKLLHCTSRMYQYYESQTNLMPVALLELLEFKLKEKAKI
jgi:transcriptional regulator with XRE-family HTH domain